MKIIIQYMAVCTVLLFSSINSNIFAQDDDPLAPKIESTPILLGPSFGINRSLHSVDLGTSPANASNQAICPRFENGQAIGFWVGGTFEYILGDVVNSKSSIITRLLYNTMPASMEQSGDSFPSIVRNADGTFDEVNSETDYKNEVVYNMISLDIQYKLNLFDSPFGIIVGPTLDLGLTRTQDQTMNLLRPLEAQFKEDPAAGVQYENDFRTIVVNRGDIPGSSAIRVGIKAGVQYEIDPGKGYIIVPHFNYNFGITNLSTADDWRVSALQFGVDIRFTIK